MKKLILAFCILFLCVSVSSGGIVDKLKSVIVRQRVAAGGGGASNFTDSQYCQGAWLFDDDTTDASGEGNTLDETSQGSADFTADYPAGFSTGKAYGVFDGSNDYIFRAHADLSANFPGQADTGDMSVCAWFKRDSDTNTEEVVLAVHDHGDANGRSWKLAIEYGASAWDELTFYIRGTKSSSGVTINDTNWHHVCVDFDLDAANEVNFYIDNAAPVAVNNDSTINAADDTPFTIACENGDDKWWDGTVYQPIIFSETLLTVAGDYSEADAAAVVAAIYATGITGAD